MGTHYQGKPAEVRALDAYIKLMRCAMSVSSRLERPLRRKGFTENQFGTLETLLHLGPLPQYELGAKLFTSRPNVTLVVRQLEERGLVRRERSGDDARCVIVSLTPAGRRLIERLFQEQLRAIVEEFSVLEPGEQVELARLAKKLGRQQRAGTEGEPRGAAASRGEPVRAESSRDGPGVRGRASGTGGASGSGSSGGAREGASSGPEGRPARSSGSGAGRRAGGRTAGGSGSRSGGASGAGPARRPRG